MKFNAIQQFTLSVVALVGITMSCHAADEKAPLLEKMKNLDSAYAATLVIQGTDTLPMLAPFSSFSASNASNAGVRPAPLTWRFTRSGNKIAFIQESPAPELKYTPIEPGKVPKPRGNGDFGEPTYDGDVEYVQFRTKCVTLFEVERSALILVSSEYSVRKDGTVKKEGESSNISYSPSDAPDLMLPVRKITLASGRGISQFLDEITEITTAADGMLQVKAKGHLEATQSGYWELVVDPKSTYLVRAMKFFLDGAKEPFLMVTNSGLKSQGNCQIPEVATFKLAMAGFSQVSEITFTSGSIATDDNLFTEARRTFDGPLPAYAVVTDTRTEPTKVFTTNGKGEIEGSKVKDDPAANPHRSQTWRVVLMANLTLLAGLAAYYIYRKIRN